MLVLNERLPFQLWCVQVEVLPDLNFHKEFTVLCFFFPSLSPSSEVSKVIQRSTFRTPSLNVVKVELAIGFYSSTLLISFS